MTADAQRVRLPDGRAVWCTSPAEALLLWDTMRPGGLYGRAADRLRPGDLVLDLGANIGLTSLCFADAQPGAVVVAVEPAPETFGCLARNLAERVPGGTAVRAAVGAEPGTHAFVYYPNAPGNSGLHADRAADDRNTRIYMRNKGLDDESIDILLDGLHDGVPMEVPVTTVSALLRGRPGEVALLKIDVERAELEALEGVAEDDWPRIRRVVAEVHDDDGRLAAFRALLHRHGLTTTVTQDPLLTGTALYEVEAERAADP